MTLRGLAGIAAVTVRPCQYWVGRSWWHSTVLVLPYTYVYTVTARTVYCYYSSGEAAKKKQSFD